MASLVHTCRRLHLLKFLRQCQKFEPIVSGGLCVQNSLHTSVSAPAGEKFRLREGEVFHKTFLEDSTDVSASASVGLPRCGNEYGPLTDDPDWSYIDGRPTPITIRQERRKNKQRLFGRRIKMLIAEIDSAHKEKECAEPVNGDQEAEEGFYDSHGTTSEGISDSMVDVDGSDPHTQQPDGQKT